MKSEKYFGRRKKTIENKSRRIATVCLVVVALLLPAILAWLDYSIKTMTPVSEDANKIIVSLYHKDELIATEYEDPMIALPASLISNVTSLINDAQKVTSVTDEVKEREPLRVTIINKNVTTEYTLYFSLTANKNYYKDASGAFYLVSDDTASHFLSSRFAQIYYKTAIPPTLLTTGGDEVVPNTVDWKYKNQSGKLIAAEGLKTEPAELTYDMSGNLGLIFETEPDDCNVEVYKSGIILYDVNYKNLATTAVEPGTTLQFKVSATYSESEESDFSGTVTYKFKVLVRNQSTFALDNTEYSAGSFALVTCTNIIDTERISFSSTPDIGYEPRFFRVSDTVYALIPFSKGLDEGDYTLKFSYGATEQSIPVKLSMAGATSLKLSGNAEISFASTLNTLSGGKYPFPTIKADETCSETVFCQQGFVSALKYTTATYEFDTHFSGESTGLSHTSFGVMYNTQGISSIVTAINSGIVAEVGENDYLGRYVVIDHGLGLRSIYAHLGAVNVSVGETIAAAQSVGRTGTTNHYNKDGLFLICTVFDIPVDPEDFIGRDLIPSPKEKSNSEEACLNPNDTKK